MVPEFLNHSRADAHLEGMPALLCGNGGFEVAGVVGVGLDALIPKNLLLTQLGDGVAEVASTHHLWVQLNPATDPFVGCTICPHKAASELSSVSSLPKICHDPRRILALLPPSPKVRPQTATTVSR